MAILVGLFPTFPGSLCHYPVMPVPCRLGHETLEALLTLQVIDHDGERLPHPLGPRQSPASLVAGEDMGFGLDPGCCPPMPCGLE